MKMSFFGDMGWEAADLGNCPKSESSRKWLERVQKVFWTPRARGLLHWCEMGLHRCKEGLGGAKDSWETFAPKAQKSQKRPFAPSPNHFGRLSFFGPYPRSTASLKEGDGKSTILTITLRELSSYNWLPRGLMLEFLIAHSHETFLTLLLLMF